MERQSSRYQNVVRVIHCYSHGCLFTPSLFFFVVVLFCFFFLGLHLWHTGVHRLGVKSEL